MIDNKILRRALEWCNYPKGITISLDVDVQSIQNRDIRDAILLDEQKQRQTPKYYRGKKRKTWYDVENNAIHVILPNIESPRELDRIILDEVLQRRGLAGLVGDNVFDQIARVVFDGQDEQTQKTFLSYVLGNEKRDGDRVAAGKLILSAQTNQFVKASNKHSKENAAKAWYRTTNKYIKPHARELFAFLSDETNLSNIIAAGIRAKAFNDNNTEKMASVTAASVGNEIIKLYDRELEGRILDVGNYIHLGRPGSILLSSAPWTKTCPVFLPLSSLYGDTRDNYNNRFITATEDIKKDKHPFSLMSLVNLKGELDTPLAVFKSIKRDNGLIAMLPSSGGSNANDKQIGHFAVPISLQEINYSKTSGLQKSPGSGKWVNYIHSIYPKPDIGFLCWLSSPGLCSYLDPSFEEKWLKPAEVRIEKSFDMLFTETGIKKPSTGGIKTILSTMSADDYIDIKSKLAKFLDLNEAGLPRVYSVYRDVLESATKIVKEFENPKTIEQKEIEFSLINKNNTLKENSTLSQYLLLVSSSRIEDINFTLTKTAKNTLLRLGIESVSQLMSYKRSDLKRLLEKSRISENTKRNIYRFYDDYLEAYEQKDILEVKTWFERFSIDDKCHFLGFADRDDAWNKLINIHPDWIKWERSDIELLNALQLTFDRSETRKLASKLAEWKRDGLEEHSETYRLATEATMYMANKLNQHGIRTVIVSENEARAALENASAKKTGANFSVRDIMNLSYTWNGEEVSMRGFAEQFMSEIKLKDRTMEDAERIAKAFIAAVKADPEKAGMKMLKAENMANAFRFKLQDGSIYTPEHPMADSPEYETQKWLWEIYEHVLGKETMREFIGLLSKNSPMSGEERKRFSELESKVNGSAIMQRSLEVPASKVNENRVKDIRNLIQYFEGNEDYTWTEKALIVKGAMSFGYSEKKEKDQTRVEIKNISDNNSVSVPVIGGDAATVVECLRKGFNFKDALVQARIMLSKESKRSVDKNFTGWKVYKQSTSEEDAIILNQDVAGTGWCTGSAVSTARGHLSGGDFHVYYEAGEPLIAIRTYNGRMAEPPRGAHEGQFCTDREEQIAFDYIKSGNSIVAGDDYIADIEDIRRVMSPNATPLDAFMMPDKRRYENGEYDGDTKAWGRSVKQRIAELVPSNKEERWKLGLYYGREIRNACKNANAVVIKGNIKLTGSSSLALPEGVTQVGDIELSGSASLTLPEGVTQVGKIYLTDSASLALPEGVTQVGDIELSSSASLTLPEGVTQVGNIYLYDSSSLTLPEGMTQVGDIELSGSSSLTLPEGMTQVGYIYLTDSASLTLPEGMTQVGKIYLTDSASLTLPEGVTRVGKIALTDSASLTLPEGVTQVGDIELSSSASLTLPEGVTQVGGILLSGFASLTLPDGVTRVGKIYLYDSSSLTLPEGVTQVGNIYLSASASLTLPEGMTQVGKIYLSSSIPEDDLNDIPFRLSDGTIYGYQQGDTIYLTPSGINPNTPIHEYAHLWAKVYERLHPSEWNALKEELKATPQWTEIANSASYSFMDNDENRLAGEVLATIVGYKGEELQMQSAKETLESTSWKRSTHQGEIRASVERFKKLVTDMAVKDVFDADGMERTGEVTLKVLQDFALGKGVKISKKDGERLAAMAEFERNRIRTTEYISKSNERFNEELQRQIEGEFDSEPHTYNLGYPGPILRSTGIPNLPIQVTSTKLYEKSNSLKHKYDLKEIKDLVKHINTPVAVFSYGDGTLAQNIIVDIEHDNSHFLVGLSLNAHIKGVALEINSIRNIFPKDNYKWMEWIQEGKSRYLDKETIKVLIAQQRTNSADVNHLDLDFVTNIVNNFENPKVDEKYFIIDNWQYYGVFLDDRSQSVIEREFRDLIPSGWKKHADHITVQYNDYSQDAITKGRALSSKLGYDYSARIVAVGKSDTAIALKVEGVETANKIAHITLAVSPEGKPVDSNKITEWTPVNPIEISGVLGLSYKGKKYFQVLNDNEVVDFQISKDSLTQPKTNMANETLPIGNDTDDITLRKAALFTAWETREDNPYEFVVDLSRTELEEFLKNSFDKLNAEDKDIVTNILNKTPGYGEDFVDKRISGESHFRPDIETLLFDNLTVGGDVLDRSMFYIATRNMNEEQMQSLHDSVKEKVIAYYAGVDNDAPNADMDKIEALTEKLLHSWFRPWTRLAGRLEYHLDKIQESEAGPVTLQHIEAEARSAMANPAYAPYIDKNLLGWILNRCVDYGLDYTMIPKDLQYEGAAETFRKEFPEYLTKPSKEAQSSLPEDFYSNFRDTMYGSEVILAQPIESTDYVLVYYNSNERENGLGMIPSEEPVLTDGSGHLLAHDRMFGPVDINHLFILADKAVVVGRPDGDDGKRPIVEIPRDKAHYDALFLSAAPDVQADMLKAYVEALTNMEAITMSEMASSYSGNIAVYNAVTALDSQKPETQNGLINAFLSLNLNEKEDVLHLALSEKAINAEMLRTLSSGKAYQEALSSWSARKNAVSETTFDAPEDLLGWMSDVKTKNLIGIPDSPGKNALERIYENALFMAEVEGKRTVEEQKENFLSFARRCKVGFVIGPDKEHRLQEMLEEAYKKGVIDINDTILIKSKYTGEYGIIQVCSVEDIVRDNKKSIQIGYQSLDDCPVLQVDSKDQIISVEYRGIDDRRPTYNYSPDGTLLSISRKNSSMYSLPDAIIDMRNELSPELEKMNYLELRGLYDELRVLRAAIVGADLCGFGKERIDLSIDVVDSLLHVVYSETAAAKQDLLQYIDRGQRTNNTIIDRLLSRTFSPTHPLPSPDDIKSAGIDNIKAGTIKETYIEKYASEKGLNLLPSTAPRTERRMSFPTGVVRESDISEMPQYFNLQLDVAGRIDGTVGLRDGSNVVVQREGNSLMSMHPQDIHDSITAQVKGTGEGRLIQVDGKDYHVEDKLIMALSYGNGQYLNTNNNERTYVVYDIKQQRLVKAEPFEKLNRERCTRKAEENKAKKQSEGLTVAKENGNKKGRGGR